MAITAASATRGKSELLVGVGHCASNCDAGSYKAKREARRYLDFLKLRPLDAGLDRLLVAFFRSAYYKYNVIIKSPKGLTSSELHARAWGISLRWSLGVWDNCCRCEVVSLTSTNLIAQWTPPPLSSS